MTDFNSTEGALLQVIQRSVPFVSCPYKEIATQLGITEDECISIVENLKGRKIIRNISAMFNPEGLGFSTALVAFSIQDKYIESAATLINSYPGVSHNYLREHAFNLWFTLAVEKKTDLNTLVQHIAAKGNADQYIIFPKKKQLKLGLILDVNGTGQKSLNDVTGKVTPPNEIDLTDKQKEIVSLLQTDLPVCRSPFREIIKRSGSLITEQQLFKTAELFKQHNLLRRYAGVLRHVRSGFVVNAMTAWKFDDAADTQQLVPFHEELSISHLYIRGAYPLQWYYPLFAMIHAHSENELSKILQNLSALSGIHDYIVLRSLKEFKKKRVIYFDDAFGAWHKKEKI